MLIEEVFGTEIPGNDAENFGSLELTSQTSAQIKGPLFC
jgi:acyl carrier protein